MRLGTDFFRVTGTDPSFEGWYEHEMLENVTLSREWLLWPSSLAVYRILYDCPTNHESERELLLGEIIVNRRYGPSFCRNQLYQGKEITYGGCQGLFCPLRSYSSVADLCI